MSLDPSDRPYAGRFVDGEHRYAVRVYYEDTDAGGVVYHASYLRFCERARSDMLALAGADIVGALAAGEGGYVVAEAHIKYHAPARLGDALLIVSNVDKVRTSACVIQQRVMCGDQLVAAVHLTVAWVGPDGRPRRQPKQWIEAFKGLQGSGTSEWMA
jgi:acyl-CoA thioester hydrolase